MADEIFCGYNGNANHINKLSAPPVGNSHLSIDSLIVVDENIVIV